MFCLLCVMCACVYSSVHEPQIPLGSLLPCFSFENSMLGRAKHQTFENNDMKTHVHLLIGLTTHICCYLSHHYPITLLHKKTQTLALTATG